MSKTNKIIKLINGVAAFGLVCLPAVSSFAVTSQTAETTVKVTISEALALAVDADEKSVELAPGSITTSTTAPKTTVTVSTNLYGGYKLTVAEKEVTGGDNTGALVHESGASVATIPARAGTLTAGTSGWNLTGGSLINAAVSTTAQNVYVNENTSHAAITDEMTEITYNIATGSAQLAGTYSDQIVYTASKN